MDVSQAAKGYFAQIAQLLNEVDITAVERVVELIQDAARRDTTLFIIGNGGSAATAAHFANDLAKASKLSAGRPLKALSLCDNSAYLTAIGNDEGYERVFSSQLENLLRPGDVVLAISASGNSPNLIAATELARRRGAATIGLLGFQGGRLLSMVDEAVLVPSPIGAYGPVEDVHLILQHLISSCLKAAPMAGAVREEALAHA